VSAALSLPDAVLVGGTAAVVLVRAAVAGTEARVRAPGWPLWRSGPAAALLVLHDVLVGASAVAMFAGAARGLCHVFEVETRLAAGLVALAAIVALMVSTAWLHRRRGIGFRSVLRPKNRVVEPCPTLRRRLLDSVELAGARGTARWIGAGLDRARRRCGATPEQMLPALWPPARLRLREAPGVPRTEVALLLLQAQSVMEDASPPGERMLTLLHLVHARAGRRGVRGALDEARRSPVRHGRSGAAAWGASPQAVPTPVSPAAPAPESIPESISVPTPEPSPVSAPS
jgi:hypothetical protein